VETNTEEIGGEGEAEEGSEDGDQIDDEAGGLEITGFELGAGAAVAEEARQSEDDTTEHGDYAGPNGHAGGMGSASLDLQEFADGHGEASDGEAEDDKGDAGADPGEEGAFVGEMIAGEADLIARLGFWWAGFGRGHNFSS
jgi:hypothetical protein